MEDSDKILINLNKWLKKGDNSKTKLANHLGYTSSVAIDMWIRRKSIPNYMKQRVKEFIK